MTAAPLARLTARPLARIDRWFTAPEPDAAGRMGLFRIVFALVYLWHLSVADSALLSGMPDLYRHHFALLAPLPADPSPAFFHAIEAALVAALVLIAVGWRTRAALGIVLLVGVVREAYLQSVAIEDSNVFLVFFIPLFMLIAGPCDQTYSLTARLRRRAGRSAVDPSDPSGRFLVPARAALVMLAALFVSSVLFKCFSGGTWLADRHVLLGVLIERHVKSTMLGLWPNPMAPWMVHHPDLAAAMQYGVLCFEGCFFLVLIGPRIRSLYLAVALVFHSINGLVLVVSFTPILAAYAMFVNWEAMRRTLRIPLRAPAWADRVPPAAAVAAACAIAVALAASWHVGARSIFSIGGLIDWRTPWFIVLPLAITWAAVSLVKLLRRRPSTP